MVTQMTRGTQTEWLASSYVLLDGQIGVARQPNGTSEIRVGDGIHPWSTLPVNLAANPIMDLRSQPGVVGDGTTDDAAAINTAAASAASLGVRLFATGTFRINSTVNLAGDCDLSQATFNYYGSGIAVQVGSAAVLFRKIINLPKIVASAKTVTGWAQVAGTTGLKILNANACRISGLLVSNFETGLLVRGEGQGCSYNAIIIAHLDNNKINHDISADATGWSNENQYWISRFSFNSGEGAVVSGTRDIRIQTATNLPNNNIWWGGSIEANTPEYHLECAGAENRFLQMRWENTVPCRVYWRSGVFRNVIDNGYGSYLIAETYEAGAIGQTILSPQGWKLRHNPGTAGTIQVENGSSSANSAVTIMAAGAGAAGSDPATAYCAQIGANMWKGKRSTESFDRVQIDAQNSRIYLGTGAAAPTYNISASGSYGLLLNGGHLGFSTDNTSDIGASTLRPRYIRAGTAVQVGSFATGSRPSASTAGAGASVFDTTLGKPIWSTGSAWVDATGATV